MWHFFLSFLTEFLQHSIGALSKNKQTKTMKIKTYKYKRICIVSSLVMNNSNTLFIQLALHKLIICSQEMPSINYLSYYSILWQREKSVRLTLSLYDSLGLAFTAAAPVAPRPADELRLPSAFKKNEQRGSVNLCKSDTRL